MCICQCNFISVVISIIVFVIMVIIVIIIIIVIVFIIFVVYIMVGIYIIVIIVIFAIVVIIVIIVILVIIVIEIIVVIVVNIVNVNAREAERRLHFILSMCRLISIFRIIVLYGLYWNINVSLLVPMKTSLNVTSPYLRSYAHKCVFVNILHKHLMFAGVLAPSTTRAQRVTRARSIDGDPTVSCVPAVSTALVTNTQVCRISGKPQHHCATFGGQNALCSYNISGNV